MLNDKAILDEFVVEAREHLAKVEEDILGMEGQDTENTAELVSRLFRAVHSIKGSAGFLGLSAIGSLTHAMEALLSMVRSGDISVDSILTDALLAGVDHVQTLLDDVDNSNEVDISAIQKRLDSLLEERLPDQAKKDRKTPALLHTGENLLPFPVSAYTLNRIDKAQHLYLLRYDLAAMEKEGKRPMEIIAGLLSAGEIVEAELSLEAFDLRQSLPRGPLSYQVLYATILEEDLVPMISGLADDAIQPVSREQACALCREDAGIPEKAPLPAAGDPLTLPPAARAQEKVEKPQKKTQKEETTSAGSAGDKINGKGGSIRIRLDILDELMTLAGELVLVRNQHLLAADHTGNLAQRLDGVTTELQQTIMRTRMQPIGNVFSKLPRMVRDLSHKLEKNIELEMEGQDVELDKTILEALADPLTHLIRNACDHGIESPADRMASGKPETGHIRVTARHEAGQIVLVLSDDGKGMDTEKIRKKALDLGLKKESELSLMTDSEICQLTMLSGFSTADRVSEVSGRGVGMDVVKTSIEALGGSLQLSSVQGQGSRFRIALPLTLAIIPCLTVRVNGERFAIPQVNLDELVCLYDEEIKGRISCVGSHEVCRLRETLLPMVRMAEVLKRPEPFTEKIQAAIARTPRNAEKSSLTFAVVKVGSHRFGLEVDEVIGTEEIVVKPMHPALKSIPVYSGATIMGDGDVALILDIDGIARHTGVPLAAGSEEGPEKSISTQPVLLTASGPHEQFAMALQLVRRVEKIAAKDIERMGQREFITLDETPTRIIRLENLLPVSACPESDTYHLLLPKFSEKPFGILFSEIRDIVDIPLDLATKSVPGKGILGAAVIRDRLSLFLDPFQLIESAEPEWFGDRIRAQEKKQQRILMAEDTVFFTQLVRNYLTSDGYQVDTAANGKEALKKLKEESYDLLVSDLEMPEMDGWELIRQVRRDPDIGGTKAIALTALATEADRTRTLNAGFDAFEVKIDRETLRRRIRSMLEQDIFTQRKTA
ncbi:two-component system chemotaxis sensor kinase CheA [Desulfobotulus alkaliphilus]|uniref:histidine kinase n=1 Tax=Desulfobotulus alkaliphilus TaxID=622671 RepID=A0A562R704_9BACT|nr:hybrid sensor histidine kinase/response regulator [Desulfobotulus alkaliphilus]TWI64841.1 two-component system chemotaxis sensor kinase CheA [Desulfobotulus alkaliphilus]